LLKILEGVLPEAAKRMSATDSLKPIFTPRVFSWRLCGLRTGGDKMRIVGMIGPLGRAAVLVALAGGVAGCASDTMRFDEGLVGSQYSQSQPAAGQQAGLVEAAQLAPPAAVRPTTVASPASSEAHKKMVAAQKPAAPKQATVAAAAPAKLTSAPAQKTAAAPIEQQVAMVSPPAAQVAARDVSAIEKPAEGGAAPSFRWPARGRVISSSGAMTNGQQNDGINLALPEGTPVHAAEEGVVAYAGSELKGYGNLVLIRHSNGFVTAYAHASEILVKRGDQVRRGQVIAKSGQTGNVSSPQLHFEIRKGSAPVDPTQYLPGA
jgi:murein DD-endopeptidase MepM/ murein hydrolase activator NlpD